MRIKFRFKLIPFLLRCLGVFIVLAAIPKLGIHSLFSVLLGIAIFNIGVELDK